MWKTIFQTHLTSTKDELKGAADKFKDITPSPMNTMLEKESKSTAVQEKMERSKITENVSPTRCCNFLLLLGT